MDGWTGQRRSRLAFHDALALSLERCERGELPEAVAADFPDHELLPYLELAQRLRQLGMNDGAAAE
jgi:hypothetical protein